MVEIAPACDDVAMTPDTQTAASSPSSSEIPDRVRRVATESPFRDVMHGDARWEIPVHDHGFVALVDAMPRPCLPRLKYWACLRSGLYLH